MEQTPLKKYLEDKILFNLERFNDDSKESHHNKRTYTTSLKLLSSLDIDDAEWRIFLNGRNARSSKAGRGFLPQIIQIVEEKYYSKSNPEEFDYPSYNINISIGAVNFEIPVDYWIEHIKNNSTPYVKGGYAAGKYNKNFNIKNSKKNNFFKETSDNSNSLDTRITSVTRNTKYTTNETIRIVINQYDNSKNFFERFYGGDIDQVIIQSQQDYKQSKKEKPIEHSPMTVYQNTLHGEIMLPKKMWKEHTESYKRFKI